MARVNLSESFLHTKHLVVHAQFSLWKGFRSRVHSGKGSQREGIVLSNAYPQSSPSPGGLDVHFLYERGQTQRFFPFKRFIYMRLHMQSLNRMFSVNRALMTNTGPGPLPCPTAQQGNPLAQEQPSLPLISTGTSSSHLQLYNILVVTALIVLHGKYQESILCFFGEGGVPCIFKAIQHLERRRSQHHVTCHLFIYC